MKTYPNKLWWLLMVTISLPACDFRKKSVSETKVAPERIHAVGYLEPSGDIRRLAFHEEGIIQRVHVSMGDRVKKGDVLAELDSPLAEKHLVLAEARLATKKAAMAKLKSGMHPDAVTAAVARVRLAEAEYSHRTAEAERYEALIASRGVSTAEADLSRHEAVAAAARLALVKAEKDAIANQPRPEELSVAAAEVHEAETDVALSRIRLDRRTLTAPSNGQILEVMKREGESFSTLAMDVAILFAPEGELLVRAEIDELDAPRVKSGMGAVVRTKSGGSEILGQVVRIKPVMGRKSIFNRRATERMDLQIVEAWIIMDESVDWSIGMEVEIRIDTNLPRER
jgi:multidrug resistance efflux pump